MKKLVCIVGLLIVCSFVPAQNVSAQSKVGPSIISAEVNVDTGKDYNSLYAYQETNFIQGFFQTLIPDIAFDIYFNTGDIDRKIKKITIKTLDTVSKMDLSLGIWSTFIRNGSPLIVYYDGTRIIDSWQPEIRTFPKNKTNKVTVYGQPDKKDLYNSQYWTDGKVKTMVEIYFTDGTTASTTSITVSSEPKKTEKLPIIEKAELVNKNDLELINESGSLSSVGIPGDVSIDLTLNMNGTNKTISYIAIKKSSLSTALWSTHQTGTSGDGVTGYYGTGLLYAHPYSLLVFRDNQRINNPIRKNLVVNLGTYSGQTKVNFRIYADKYAGPDFTENSEIFVVFTDGTIVRKNITISNSQTKPSSADPIITKVTVSENNVKSNSIRESMYGNSNYWLWNIDLDLKNRNRNISYVSIFMRNQRWSTDEAYGSLLNLYDNGKVISNTSKKILGSIGIGSKKLTVYGLKANDQRYDIDGPGSIYILFDDGYVTSYSLSSEEVSTIFQNNDIEFPVIPEYKYLDYGYNPGEGVVLQWKQASDNVGVVGYKVYRAKYITPSKGASYKEPYVEIGDTKNTYFIDADSSLDKSKYYFYYVRAYDLAGNLSFPYYSSQMKIADLIASHREVIIEKNIPNTPNDTIPVSTKDQTAPSVPTNLTTRAISTTKIDFSWSPSTDNVGVAGYKIYRDEKEISSTKGTSYSDNGLSAGTSYSYYVKAYDSAGNLSQRSSYLTEFTQNPPAVINNPAPSDTQAPSYPPNLNIRAISSSQIEISWSPSTDNVGVTGYIIYRNNGEISRTTGTSYRDSGLLSGTDYSYNVKAFDAAGNQSYMSNSVTEWTLSGTSYNDGKPTNYLANAISAISLLIFGR